MPEATQEETALKIRFEDAGRPRDAILAALEEMRGGDADWKAGRVPLYVFSGPPAVQALGKEAFNAYFTENALGGRRAFPSLLRMEQEVVGMGLDLFSAPDGAAGNMTSGGTESIVMAVKACRDQAARVRAATASSAAISCCRSPRIPPSTRRRR